MKKYNNPLKIDPYAILWAAFRTIYPDCRVDEVIFDELEEGYGLTNLRDLDLLDENDWYGITLSCFSATGITEPFALDPYARLEVLEMAHKRGIKTWISFEPVTDAAEVLDFLKHYPMRKIDKVKIGKLNYHKSDIDWAEFGRSAEALCKDLGLDYYIKESLRAEMEAGK